ncbi:MAG: hypothetical protein OEV06_03520 [Anaerolineae bacterium]|nr:hypothetical protein [Anaerolineae bacterium]
MGDRVESHSSHAYEEEPRALHWLGDRLVVLGIEKSWRTPGKKHFLVRVQGEAVFELVYSIADEAWSIFPQ